MPMDLRQFITQPAEMERQILEEALPPDQYGRVLHQWRAPEFEVYEKSNRWYFLAGLFLLAIITYAMLTDGPIMAITFILIGIVGYLNLQKNPRIVRFALTTEGLIADKDMYLYENINSFWIFYEPQHTKLISLNTKASMFPFVHIPLADEDPVKIREIILEYVPELKQEPSMIDTIEKVLHV